MIRSLIIAVVVIGFISCEDEDDCAIDFGEPFVVFEGEEYCLPDGSTLFISEFNSQSYCPCNALCNWPGEGYIGCIWTDPSGSTSTIKIHEVRENYNPSWASITNLTLNDACEVDILSAELKIEKSNVANCTEALQVSLDLYENGPSDDVYIYSAAIYEDCLTIGFLASGCTASQWQLSLLDRGDMALAENGERSLRLSLANSEECDNVIYKEQSFDISILKNDSTEFYDLNLFEHDGALQYRF